MNILKLAWHTQVATRTAGLHSTCTAHNRYQQASCIHIKTKQYYVILYSAKLYCTILYYTIYYILYTIYYILLYYTILYYILYTIYYILYTIYYILYTIYYILYTIYENNILYTIYYILYYTIPDYDIYLAPRTLKEPGPPQAL